MTDKVGAILGEDYEPDKGDPWTTFDRIGAVVEEFNDR